MPKTITPWDDQQVADLKKYWAQTGGKVISVAKLMRRTPNSIIGKSNRLGLQYHPDGGGRVVKEGSAADVEAHTVFRHQVRPVDNFVLKPGSYQRKIGGVVRKGKWKGMPIFVLTLEERATCPRSCEQWFRCYGNGSPRAVRYEHGPALEAQIWRELTGLQERYPGGFIVRTHQLGDFYSVEYVRMWEMALDAFPALRVWGYTARRSREAIGRAVEDLRDRRWDRFAVRSSGGYVGPRTKVVIKAWKSFLRGAILCPAQNPNDLGRTCANCGLCWSPTAKNKVIAFLRH